MRADPCGRGSGILEIVFLRRDWRCRIQAIPELVRSLSEQRMEGGNHLPACGIGSTGAEYRVSHRVREI